MLGSYYALEASTSSLHCYEFISFIMACVKHAAAEISVDQDQHNVPLPINQKVVATNLWSH